MPKLQEHNEKFHISVPKSLVIAKRWKAQQELIFEFNEKGELVLKEVK